MMKKFKMASERKGLVEAPEGVIDGCWVQLVNPTKEEIASMNAYGIPLDMITAALDVDEPPRIEVEGSFTLVIVDAPLPTGEEVLYDTFSLGLLVAPTFLVTISMVDFPFLEEIVSGRVKVDVERKGRLMLQLLLLVNRYYLKYLKIIDREANAVERDLRHSTRNKELIQLFNLEKSLVFFSTSLSFNTVVLEKLWKQRASFLLEDDAMLLEDVMIENEQAIEMATIYSTILSGMMDAFASVINNNMSLVVKFLTAITIILSIPMIIASFWGMNVGVPFAREELAFLAIIGLTAICILVVAYYMHKKDWL